MAQLPPARWEYTLSTPVYYNTRIDKGWQHEGTIERYNETSQSPNFISRTTSTLHPLAYVNGSPVAYKRVVEKTAGNGAYLGRTERYFTSFEQAPVMLVKPFPFTPPEYKEWSNGLLDSVLIYDASGFLVRKEVNNYQFHIDNYWQDPVRFESFRSVSIAPVKYLYNPHEPGVPPYVDEFIPCWIYPRYFKAEFFYPDAGRAELASNTTYDYDRSGGVIKTGIAYTHDPGYLYLRSSTSASSAGDQLTKKLNYPQDMVASGHDPDGVYQEMAGRNIHNPVVEEIEHKNSKQLFLVRKKYSNPHPGVYVPQTVEVQNGSDPVETRLRYHTYDKRGKALTVYREGDVSITYLWGYNHSLPIAEIKNASYPEVEIAEKVQ